MKIQTYFLELQYRIFFSFLNFSFLFFFFSNFREEVTFLILYCIKGEFPYFISTHLTEIFSVHLKVSFFFSLYFAIPFLIFQLAWFFNPGLYKYESETLQTYLWLSFFIYCGGTVLIYKIFIPYCWEFFSSFQTSSFQNYVGIHFETKLHSFCKFFLKSFFFLQFFFQVLCFLFFFLPKFQPSFYKISRKLIYFFFLGIATLASPPDITSQLFLTFAFIVFYESFIFFLFLNQDYQRAKNGG